MLLFFVFFFFYENKGSCSINDEELNETDKKKINELFYNTR